MDEIEGRVLAWLRERHGVLQERGSVTALLKDCISRSVAQREALPPLFQDLDEALEHLERMQRGF